jgi:hypothetical protein
LAAGLLWSAVGSGLLIAGTRWLLTAPWRIAAPVWVLAVAAGFAKARFVLDRPARRIVSRIEERGDSRCLGGFLSWRSWILVALMMALGRLLRESPLPIPARGAIYAVIGVALLAASLRVWAGWRKSAGDAC